MRTLGWTITLLGLWLVMSPFILGTAGRVATLTNDVVAGGILALLGLAVALHRERSA